MKQVETKQKTDLGVTNFGGIQIQNYTKFRISNQVGCIILEKLIKKTVQPVLSISLHSDHCVRCRDGDEVCSFAAT